MLAVPPIRAAILSPKAWPYLLLARFAGDKAAPLDSPLVVDVGTLTITDASNVLSQARGALVVNGTPAAASGINRPTTFTRQAGRALLLRLANLATVTTGTARLGWSTLDATSNSLEIGCDYSSTTAVRIKTGSSLIDTVTLGAAPHDFAAAMRATGGFLLARAGGGNGPYTLLWVYNASAAAEYPKFMAQAGAAINVQVDDFRVLDLPAPWNGDYGIATSRNAGAVARGTTFDCAPDAVVEHVLTTLPPTTVADIRLREQDASNHWIVRVNADGSTALLERIAGTSTARASNVAGTVTAGNRIVTIMDGSTIKVYVSDVLKMTYSSASSLATQRGGSVASSNEAAAVISDVIAWPRTLSLPSGV